MKYLSVVVGVLLAWIMVICAQTAIAQEGAGAERLIERTYAISDVDALSIGVRGTMEVVFGDKERLEITASKQALERIKVDAKGRELRIHNTAKSWWGNNSSRLHDKTHYRLVLKHLHKITVSGVVHVGVAAGIKSRKFELDISGPSVVNIPDLAHVEHLSVNASGPSELLLGGVNLDVLNLQMSGPANVELMGDAAQANINMSGPSSLLAATLMLQRANLNMSGPSDAKVWVVQTLNASLSGPAELAYYGDAKVKTATAGPSDVRYLGAEPVIKNTAKKNY